MSRRVPPAALAVVLALVAGGAAGVAIAVRRAADAPSTAVVATADAPAMPPAETFDPVFEPCAHCHQIGVGARDTSGPSLQGLIGRKAGQGGYPYSPAMRDSGLVWDEDTLSRFIAEPQRVVPGTRMIFPGIGDSAQRQAVVSYINRVGGASR